MIDQPKPFHHIIRCPTPAKKWDLAVTLTEWDGYNAIDVSAYAWRVDDYCCLSGSHARGR